METATLRRMATTIIDKKKEHYTVADIRAFITAAADGKMVNGSYKQELTKEEEAELDFFVRTVGLRKLDPMAQAAILHVKALTQSVPFPRAGTLDVAGNKMGYWREDSPVPGQPGEQAVAQGYYVAGKREGLWRFNTLTSSTACAYVAGNVVSIADLLLTSTQQNAILKQIRSHDPRWNQAHHVDVFGRLGLVDIFPITNNELARLRPLDAERKPLFIESERPWFVQVGPNGIRVFQKEKDQYE